jgi:hypothetical protein
MAYNVFISYSHKDKPIADAVCANIESAGMRCWIAPRDIAPGMDWPTAISKALTQCQVMVLIFSTHSNSSSDVGRELILAANNNLVIVPFRLDDITPEPGKQYYLARTHWLDAMNPPTQEQIDNLVASVRAFLVEKDVELASTKETAAEAKKAAPRKKETKRNTKWVWTTLISLLGIAVLISGVLFLPKLLTPPQLTPSPSPTHTLYLSPTFSPTPDWVTSFAQPIWDYFGNNEIWGRGSGFSGNAWWTDQVNFNFDNCATTYHWDIDFRNGDGIAYMKNGCLLGWNNKETDFMAEMVVNVDAPGEWDFTFRGFYTLTFSYSGEMTLSSSHNEISVTSVVPDEYWYVGDFNRIQVFVQDRITAVLVNGHPMAYEELEEGLKGGVGGWHTEDSVIFDEIYIKDLGEY